MANQRANSAELLDNAKRLRREPSDAERKLWSGLRNRNLGGLKFRRQVSIGPYIADFACDEVRLILEVDGKQHDEPAAIAYDEERTAYLEQSGWRVTRFYAGDIVRRLDEVLRQILNCGRPSP